MKRLRLIKVIASSLIIASLLALNPIGASAELQVGGIKKEVHGLQVGS